MSHQRKTKATYYYRKEEEQFRNRIEYMKAMFLPNTMK